MYTDNTYINTSKEVFMKIIIGVIVVTCLLFSTGCKGLDSLNIIKSGSKDGLDEKTVIAGLKEALEIGTKNTVT